MDEDQRNAISPSPLPREKRDDLPSPARRPLNIMPRQRPKTATAKPKPNHPTAPRRSLLDVMLLALLRFVFHPGRLAVLSLVLFAIASRPQWEPHVPKLATDPAYQIGTAEIHISPAPRPVPEDLVERIVAKTEADAEMSLLDPTLLPRLAAGFEQSPWVRRVVRLTKELPAWVNVELEYRLPIAVVESSEGLVPLGDDAIVLPIEDLSEGEWKRYPRLKGIVAAPPEAAGEIWEEPTIQAALEIARVLVPAWEELDLLAIRRIDRRGGNAPAELLQFGLETGSGSVVIWGAPPGKAPLGEPTAPEKLRRLRDCLAASGSPLEIDLRPWDNPVRRPLPAGSGTAVTALD